MNKARIPKVMTGFEGTVRRIDSRQRARLDALAESRGTSLPNFLVLTDLRERIARQAARHRSRQGEGQRDSPNDRGSERLRMSRVPTPRGPHWTRTHSLHVQRLAPLLLWVFEEYSIDPQAVHAHQYPQDHTVSEFDHDDLTVRNSLTVARVLSGSHGKR